MDESEDSASLARSVLEQLADAVIFSDAAGNIVLWNAAAAGLFGHSAAEAVGQSLNLIIPEHLQREHWRGFAAAIESGVPRGAVAVARGVTERIEQQRAAAHPERKTPAE